MGILRNLQRRSPHEAVQKLMAPESLAKLLSETEPSGPQTEISHFQFVVILVDETRPNDIPPTIGKVVHKVLKHGAILSSVTSSLLVGRFGVPFPERDSPEERRRLVDVLLQENGDRIRIAHGQCDGAVGMLGAGERVMYGEIIPDFSGILRMLLETKFGTAVEVS